MTPNVYKIGKITILLVIIPTTIIYGFGKSSPPSEKTCPPEPNELKIWLSTSSKSFVAGDTVWFTIKLFNPSKDTIKELLSTPLPARFTVSRDGHPVWHSDYGLAVAQVITPISVPPNDTLPLRSFWTGRDNQGKWLPLGKYIVDGCFLKAGKTICFQDTVFIVD